MGTPPTTTAPTATVDEIGQKIANYFSAATSTASRYAGSLAAMVKNYVDTTTGAIDEKTKALIDGYSDYIDSQKAAASASAPAEVLDFKKWVEIDVKGKALRKEVDDRQLANAGKFIENYEKQRQLTDEGRNAYKVVSETAGHATDTVGGMFGNIGEWLKNNRMGAIGAVLGLVGLVAGLGVDPIIALLGAVLIGGAMGAFGDKNGMLAGFMGGGEKKDPNPYQDVVRQRTVDVRPNELPQIVRINKDGKKEILTSVNEDGHTGQYGDKPGEKAVEFEQKQTVKVDEKQPPVNLTVITAGQVTPTMDGFQVSDVSVLLDNGARIYADRDTLPTAPLTADQDNRINLAAAPLNRAKENIVVKVKEYTQPKVMQLLSENGKVTDLGAEVITQQPIGIAKGGDGNDYAVFPAGVVMRGESGKPEAALNKVILRQVDKRGAVIEGGKTLEDKKPWKNDAVKDKKTPAIILPIAEDGTVKGMYSGDAKLWADAIVANNVKSPEALAAEALAKAGKPASEPARPTPATPEPALPEPATIPTSLNATEEAAARTKALGEFSKTGRENIKLIANDGRNVTLLYVGKNIAGKPTTRTFNGTVSGQNITIKSFSTSLTVDGADNINNMSFKELSDKDSSIKSDYNLTDVIGADGQLKSSATLDASSFKDALLIVNTIEKGLNERGIPVKMVSNFDSKIDFEKVKKINDEHKERAVGSYEGAPITPPIDSQAILAALSARRT